MNLYRISRWPYNAYWWLQHRLNPRHRYHVIPTGLRPDYWDIDTRMLHGCMTLLSQYVETQMGGLDALVLHIERLRVESAKVDEHQDWSASLDRSIACMEEARDIYEWWTVKRPADLDALDAWNEQLFGNANDHNFIGGDIDENFAFEAALLEQEQVMLCRLIAIRGSLWS